MTFQENYNFRLVQCMQAVTQKGPLFLKAIRETEQNHPGSDHLPAARRLYGSLSGPPGSGVREVYGDLDPNIRETEQFIAGFTSNSSVWEAGMHFAAKDTHQALTALKRAIDETPKSDMDMLKTGAIRVQDEQQRSANTKYAFKLIALVTSIAAAVICLTVQVGTSRVGGAMGTIVLHQGTSDESIEQTRSVLRLAGFGWTVIAFGCLVWTVRSSQKGHSTLSAKLFRPLGFLAFGIGVIGGLIFAVRFGSGSSEFRHYFGYFVALYMIGAMFTWLGRNR